MWPLGCVLALEVESYDGTFYLLLVDRIAFCIDKGGSRKDFSVSLTQSTNCITLIGVLVTEYSQTYLFEYNPPKV